MRKILFVIIFTASLFALQRAEAQDDKASKDSLVRLIEATRARLVEDGGMTYREVAGPAVFLHNNTYLKCDSAVWNVNYNIIDALGHVQLIQEETFLEGDKLTYYIESSVAQVRGEVVRLYNKKGDELKTKYLDYNTKDSIAFFYNGGAMRSVGGDIAEGDEGKYVSQTGVFSFRNHVDIYSDSIFVSSNYAEYDSKAGDAKFGDRSVAYKEQDTLFTNDGDYRKALKIMTIRRDNYIAAASQEMWADSISYFKEAGNAECFSDVQIRDNENSTVLLGERGYYKKEPMLAFLTDKACAAMYSEEKTGVDSVTNRPIYKRDTLFLAADTLKMRTFPQSAVAQSLIDQASQRKMLADRNPMDEYDKANAAFFAAYKRNKENAGKPQPPPSLLRRRMADSLKANVVSDSLHAVDSLHAADSQQVISSLQVADNQIVTDTLKASLSDGLKIRSDSLTMRDSLSVVDTVAVVDTIKYTFLNGHHKVRIFRSDLRGVCDSLVYTSIDSIARMYVNPALWNDEKNQFTSDSIQLSVRNNEVYKANLIENAFIISQEDSVHFDQIKSTEMITYFKDNEAYRFDAIGGATVMAFIKERDSVVTLMNYKECKLLTARLADKTIRRIRYIENLKSDVKPTFRLPLDQQRLRDFKWRIEEMPRSRFELTTRRVKPSRRGILRYERVPRYKQTEIYFPESYEEVSALAADIRHKILRQKREKEAQKQENNTN